MDDSNTYQIEPRTHTMEYFVYAESDGYDAILNQAAQNWNGIANVSLVRTATPSDNYYEIGIYESPSPADTTINGQSYIIYGNTTSGYNSSYKVVFSEIHTYKANIDKHYNSNTFYIKNKQNYYLANAMHEVGHALLLFHTYYDNKYGTAYDVSRTVPSTGSTFVPHIMNAGSELGGSLSVVDRDHLRIKWGA